ncbi:hypothetical protein RhiJN_24814 [Ceratobasidium sp. AG-Ba]|nr:hypothetical protein RhiJN_24814 [Ceratobasidium sp. AG-Ba]
MYEDDWMTLVVIHSPIPPCFPIPWVLGGYPLPGKFSTAIPVPYLFWGCGKGGKRVGNALGNPCAGSRVTSLGCELKEMAKILLPVVSDQDKRVVAAARALLDFMYLAHSSALTDGKLAAMERCLRTFHHNKSVFKQLGALKTREVFHGIPKIHMIQHYVKLIQMLGTPDGYNTETSERLHINFAKMGYRASNRVNAIKQMALYIQRVEAIAMHAEHLEETGAGVSCGQRIVEHQLANELDEAEDEWDEWWEEEEEEDPDELCDTGVRQELTVLLDEFLDGKRARVGGRWEQEPAEPGEHADQGPRRFHPVPDVVVAKTPTNSVTLNVLQRQNNTPQLCHSLELYLR